MVVQTLLGLVSTEAAEAINWVVLGALLAVPLSFLYGLLRSRFGATTRRLVAELSEKRTPEEVQVVLRRALRDPTLEPRLRARSGLRLRRRRRAAAADARTETDRIVTRIGEAVIVHDASLREQPELDEVVHAARIALERVFRCDRSRSERRAAVLDAITTLPRVGRRNAPRLPKGVAVTPKRGEIYPGCNPSSLVS